MHQRDSWGSWQEAAFVNHPGHGAVEAWESRLKSRTPRLWVEGGDWLG